MNRVVVTGTGAVSPFGATPAALWRGLIEGRAGIRSLPRMGQLEVTSGGEVDDIPLDRVDRDELMATRAIDDALTEAHRDPTATGLVWGTGLDTYQRSADGLAHRSAGRCFAALAARFAAPRRMIAVACATGTAAIGEAFRLVRSGRTEVCVAGGFQGGDVGVEAANAARRVEQRDVAPLELRFGVRKIHWTRPPQDMSHLQAGARQHLAADS